MDHEVFQDPQALDKIKKKEHLDSPRIYPTYQSSGDFLFIDIAKTDFELIKSDLIRMGLMHDFEAHELQENTQEEYLCLYCDKESDKPGVCEIHNARLLEYSEWAKLTGGTPDARRKSIFLLVIVACIAIVYLVNYLRT